jgi:hypothetical protein
VVELLVKHGASAAALNTYSRTPIDECLGKPYQDDIMNLIDTGQPESQEQDDEEFDEGDDSETYVDKAGQRVPMMTEDQAKANNNGT